MMDPHQRDELTSTVQTWIDQDVDSGDQIELGAVLARHKEGDLDATTELEDRFAKSLEFGTAGLRGAMAGGPNRMNRAVVIRAAAGICDFLSASISGADGGPPKLVIGYDARHRSHAFALDTAAVATAAGCEVLLLPQPWPTPVLAFAINHFECDAAVMVTASHNPAADNGYKVYLGGRVVTDEGQGAQLVPPFDADIAARIAAAPPAVDVPRADGGWTVVDDSVHRAYIERVSQLSVTRESGSVRIVHTALHGVGSETFLAVTAAAGYTDVHSVSAQQHPDPDFPTVVFPNPEEPGAMDLALDLAREVGADVVIGHDPDADRVALGMWDRRAGAGQGAWRMLHGDEVGALLGEYISLQRSRLRIAPFAQVLANSIVSSRLLIQIAQYYRFSCVQTLTGFKWISRVPGLVFGYEEALGYCVDPTAVRDKDGISAAVVALNLISQVKAEGRTLTDLLDDLARRHGVYRSRPMSLRFTRTEEIAETLNRVVVSPPGALVGSPVADVVDLSQGSADLPPTPGLLLLTEDETRVIIRPSGTEPKLKAYLEVIATLDGEAAADDLDAAYATADSRLTTLTTELMALLT